jgi:arylsulfatase A-like enzyme
MIGAGGIWDATDNVPFIARWPGKIAAGKVESQSLISAVDLLPTFGELAGAKLPTSYTPDGISQVATLMRRPAPERTRPLFWRIQASWPPRRETPDHWAGHVVVDQHWKLLASTDGSHVKLYDLQNDPLEKDDLSASQPELVNRLRQQLDAPLSRKCD